MKKSKKDIFYNSKKVYEKPQILQLNVKKTASGNGTKKEDHPND